MIGTSMADKNGDNDKDDTSGISKRVRRFSIFLILGVATLLAVAIWLGTSWYSARYYGNDSPLTKLPPPPAVEKGSPPSEQQ